MTHEPRLLTTSFTILFTLTIFTIFTSFSERFTKRDPRLHSRHHDLAFRYDFPWLYINYETPSVRTYPIKHAKSPYAQYHNILMSLLFLLSFSFSSSFYLIRDPISFLSYSYDRELAEPSQIRSIWRARSSTNSLIDSYSSFSILIFHIWYVIRIKPLQ